jgi:hypothetical protein
LLLYHRTWAVSAGHILRGGFVNGIGGFVWVADSPVEPEMMKGGQGGGGDVVLQIEMPRNVVESHPFDERKKYKAYRIPAEQLNLGKVSLAFTDYQGLSRRHLVTFFEEATAAEAVGHPRGLKDSKWAKAATYREALDFLDEFGRLQ